MSNYTAILCTILAWDQNAPGKGRKKSFLREA